MRGYRTKGLPGFSVSEFVHQCAVIHEQLVTSRDVDCLDEMPRMIRKRVNLRARHGDVAVIVGERRREDVAAPFGICRIANTPMPATAEGRTMTYVSWRSSRSRRSTGIAESSDAFR